MENIYGQQQNHSAQNIPRLTRRLDTLLLTLKNCKGGSCQRPWETVFPGGQIRDLQDAMDASYDEFFNQQPQVSFDECTKGYIPELEGPFSPLPYDDFESFQFQRIWDEYYV